MRLVVPALGCVLLALAPGCTRPPVVPLPTAVSACAAPPASYYEAGGAVPGAISEEIVHRSTHIDIRRYRIPARVPDALRGHTHATDDIEIVLFRPRPLGGTPRPCVVMSPILGNSLTLMSEFARGFVRAGYHGAVVMRKEFEVEDDMVMEDAETEFRLLVMRSKQAMDWLAVRDDVDATRFATFGISAGSIISACVAGADARPKAHVLFLAGGPLADVMIDTTEDRFQRYAEELPGTRKSKEEVRTALRRVLSTDPIHLASNVTTEDVFMILAKYDTAVPIRNGMLLWRALGKPRLRVVPLGHYTAFFLFPWMQAQANAFLREKLGPP